MLHFSIDVCQKNFLRTLVACYLLFSVEWVYAQDLVSVRTQALDKLAIYPESTAPAQVISLNDSPIAAAVDASIVEIPVRVGDRVQIGTLLAKLDCSNFELERLRLLGEQQALQAKNNLYAWQLKQAQTLTDQQILPEEQLQEKRSQLLIVQGDLAALSARIETTNRQISHCAVRAPFNGVVTARLIAVGQFAARGTPLVRLTDLTQPEITAQIPIQAVLELQQTEQLTFEINQQRYPLKIRSVLPLIRAENGTQEVRLEFIGKSEMPGAAGRLVWRSHGKHLPAGLLVKRAEQLGIFVEQNNMVHFVTLANAQNGRPTPVDMPGSSQIVISGQFSLQDGMAVKVEQ